MYDQMMMFVAVAEEQSFTKAAHRLSITTTAVSKQIMHLEAKLGHQLLQRDTRKVSVTEIGERFYEHCKRLENEMRSALSFMQSQKIEPEGELKILVSVFFADFFLTKNVFEFHQRFPKIKLSIEIADRIPDMDKEDYDVLVGFRHYPQIPEHLRQKQLLITQIILCASPNYLKKKGTPQIPQDLRKLELINHPLRKPQHTIRFEDGTQIFMDPPEIMINSMNALIELCCQGAGIIMVAKIQVEDLIRERKLIELLPDYNMGLLPVNLYYRYTEYEQPKLRCFIDFLIEKLKKSS